MVWILDIPIMALLEARSMDRVRRVLLTKMTLVQSIRPAPPPTMEIILTTPANPGSFPVRSVKSRDDLFRTPKHYARLSPQRQTYLARYPPRREYRELSPQHGVDVNRIMAGLDVRTTVGLDQPSSKELN